jgi:hypothetical protein
MKKLISLVCIALIWCSCSKNNNIKPQHTGPELDTISADVDGVKTFWNEDSLYIDHTSSYGIWIGGEYPSKSEEGNEIDFRLDSPLPIVAGTYISGSGNNLNSTTYNLYYYPDIADFASALDTIPPPTITITSITDSTIEGTFYGYLKGVSGSTVIYKNFTNGKFHLFTKNDPE